METNKLSEMSRIGKHSSRTVHVVGPRRPALQSIQSGGGGLPGLAGVHTWFWASSSQNRQALQDSCAPGFTAGHRAACSASGTSAWVSSTHFTRLVRMPPQAELHVDQGVTSQVAYLQGSVLQSFSVSGIRSPSQLLSSVTTLACVRQSIVRTDLPLPHDLLQPPHARALQWNRGQGSVLHSSRSAGKPAAQISSVGRAHATLRRIAWGIPCPVNQVFEPAPSVQSVQGRSCSRRLGH